MSVKKLYGMQNQPEARAIKFTCMEGRSYNSIGDLKEAMTATAF